MSQGPLQAVWIGPALLLARRVRVEEGTFLQGCWLDWDVIRRDLMERAADLLPARQPGARARDEASRAPTRMLASLPVRLVPGSTPDEPEPRWSPVRLSLLIAWACLALAAVAVALVLRGALALSERRGTFVSAVTHELRTPLTTFRLYTEMLDEGMVASPDSQRSYLKTIRAEADRLGHLVENVLSFARLERGRAADRPRGRRARRRCSTAWSRGSRCERSRPGWSSSVGPVDAQSRTCAWTFRWSIRSCRTWSIMRSSTRAARPTGASIWTLRRRGDGWR